MDDLRMIGAYRNPFLGILGGVRLRIRHDNPPWLVIE